jgi:hypothetical protein
MKKWSDLWETPKGVLITIAVLLFVCGIFNRLSVQDYNIST